MELIISKWSGRKRGLLDMLRKLALVTLVCFWAASCEGPAVNGLTVNQQNKIDPIIFEDKIPLHDAVKKACLISELRISGGDQVLGPRDDIKLQDNFLRSLLVHCNISEKKQNSVATNSVVIAFHVGSEADAELDAELPHYNLVASISVNARVVFQGYKSPYDNYNFRGGGFNTPEIALAINLNGLKYPKNPVKVFNNVCGGKFTAVRSDYISKIRFEFLRGLEDTIKVAPLEATGFCSLNGGVKKCPESWQLCDRQDPNSALCNPKARADELSADYGNIASRHTPLMSSVVQNWPNDNSIIHSDALPFVVTKNGTQKKIWLQSLQAGAVSNPNYDPTRDPQCSSAEELVLVQSVRAGVVSPWLDPTTRGNMQCLDEKAPLSYPGVTMDRDACSPFPGQPYPEYTKGGYCGMSLSFETIVDGGSVFAISQVSIGGTGIGLTEAVRECFSTVAVAE
jgi:hypothetical protein